MMWQKSREVRQPTETQTKSLVQEEKQKHRTTYSQARALDNIRQCVTCSHKCHHWQRTEDGTVSHKLSN